MHKPLRIAMFFSSDPSAAGGVQEHVYYLAKSLKDIGHKVTVFGANRKPLLPYPDYHRLGKFFEIDLKPIGEPSYINKSDHENYEDIFNPKKFDLFHIHDPFMPFLSYSLMDEIKLPIIATFHAAWERSSPVNIFTGFIPLFTESFSNKISGVIYVSKTTKKCWQPSVKKNIYSKVINNAVDGRLFKFRKKNAENVIKLLFLSRIVPRKGLKYLLDSLKKIINKNENIRLMVVGTGSEEEKMKNYVKNNGLRKYVEFVGYVKDDKKSEYYQKSDIFCVPHVNEGFGITLLEAMSCGLPIVGFKNDAYKEVLKNYPYKKFLVTPKSVSQLTKALENLINNEVVRKKITQWELKESKKYRWDKVAKETEELYYEIIE